MPRTVTKYYPCVIAKEMADQYYQYLKEAVPWIPGIYSKRGGKITRQGYGLNPQSFQSDHDRVIQGLIDYCGSRVKIPDFHITLGAYINYYKDGHLVTVIINRFR